MTYFDKYLKYKNKYLEIKDTIGGAKNNVLNKEKKPFTYKEINKLWAIHKHETVTYTTLAYDFSQYCWIGPPKNYDPRYQAGFFIYKVNFDNYYIPGDNKEVFRIYFIKRESDVDQIVKLKATEKIKEGKDKFFTSIPLDANDDGITLPIPIGTTYEWNHEANAWIYYINNLPIYKADFGKKKI
jgi:hypothetical protein